MTRNFAATTSKRSDMSSPIRILVLPGLTAGPSVIGKRVILFDDKYQSGMTLQFVASKLLEAGATDVYGLCAVKTWRDTDNT